MKRTELIEQIKAAAVRARGLGPRDLLDLCRQQLRYWGRIFRRSFRLFVDNRGPYQANALAYRTMISMVPMLAFTISLLSWIFGSGIEELNEKLKSLIQEYIVPDSHILEATFGIINQFVTQAKQGTIIGFIILLLTSIFLINAIETIFNNIWHINRRRPWARRIMNFTAMTILIPTLLGLSIYMTARISIDQVAQVLTQNAVARHIPIIQWFWDMFQGNGVPLATGWALFLAMYKWLPNTRVETTAAALSSFFAALAFEISKWGFSLFAAQMVLRRQIWWGPLGVFLVFLVWVYVIWLIILFGAQLAYVIQNYRYVLRINPDLEKRVGEIYLACRVMLEIGKSHLGGGQVPSVRKLAGKLEVEVPRIQAVLGKLMDSNLVILGTTSDDKGDYEEVYVPGRDLGTITVAEVIRTVNDAWRIPSHALSSEKAAENGKYGSPLHPPHGPEATPELALDHVLSESRATLEAGLNVSFRDLIMRT
ncbi:MAG TPA: YihY/virulence factor BrkB family protein [bacterium]|nr:YihY/virulence factor BrkB family protein [bacterium]